MLQSMLRDESVHRQHCLLFELEDAVGPMCSMLSQHIGYSPEVRLCTRTGGRIVWHREETAEAGFRESDELVVIDEYGKVVPLQEFLTSVGVKQGSRL